MSKKNLIFMYNFQALVSIIDLYSKFLIAFIGIVTPALALYLNNFLINRTKFEKLVQEQEKMSAETKDIQDRMVINNPSAENIKLTEESDKELEEAQKTLAEWKKIVGKLDPRAFFKDNLTLLSLSLFFLFVWLFMRAYGPDKHHMTDCYKLLKIGVAAISVGACCIHIFNLIKMGFYLIDVRPAVDEINDHIKGEKIITKIKLRDKLGTEIVKEKL